MEASEVKRDDSSVGNAPADDQSETELPPNEFQDSKQFSKSEEIIAETIDNPVDEDATRTLPVDVDVMEDVEHSINDVTCQPLALDEKIVEAADDGGTEDFARTVVTTSPPVSAEDFQEKILSEGENSPPATDDSLGRRKRKPSRFHDSMFDIPTKLMNINRTINPEEFRAFHSKSGKQKEKEKTKKVVAIPALSKPVVPKPDLIGIPEKPIPSAVEKRPSTSILPEARTHEDDILDGTSMFKFKMRKDHVIQNTVGGPTAYKCDICMMTFPRSFSLRRHYTRRHINPRYVLPKSGSIILTEPENLEIPEKLPELINDDGNEANYLYACKMCSKNLMYFKHKNHLRVHCQEMHSNEPRRSVSVFKCEVCKRSYTTRHELERHKRTHSGERPYACGFCHKTFPTSTNARRHERTHTGDRPHVCKVCNKGFIQRTDMVKHLKSIHKMKVTKTKAERADSRKPVVHTEFGGNRGVKYGSVSNKASGYGADISNEFQENIDFAAYLKLDQHDSGTLMGEKALQRGALGPFLGKEKQTNNSNNHVTGGTTSNNLKDLQPSEIMGEDGRPEKCHRCPDCSKMFTSNINLRRHHKLKHERNQLYQCAEPVSMVVEKYKIKDETAGAVFESGGSVIEEQQKDEDGSNLAAPQTLTDDRTPDLEVPVTGAKGTDVDNNVPSELVKGKDESIAHKQTEPIVSPPNATKKAKISKNSKLSSIVQRLADKISADRPREGNEGLEILSAENQPIAKLEEMGSQLFGRSFSPDEHVMSMSAKRKKRKPTSVQQVKSEDFFEESSQFQADMKPRLMPEKIFSKSTITKLGDAHRSAPRLFSDSEGRFQKVFRRNDNRASPMNLQQGHPDNEFARKSGRFQGSHYQNNEFRHRTSMAPDCGFAGFNDISKSFASLTQEPFPLAKMPPNLPSPEPGHVADTSRIESFLSQCWSSRRRDIPQNAILGRNMPSRDAYDMTRRLKDNMRHLSDEKINEHLPPSAYFSRRDNLTNASNVSSPNISGVFEKDGSPRNPHEREIPPFPDGDKYEEMQVKSEIVSPNVDGSSAPLDLRVPSKKLVQDYVVRDDGVLDFSQKTRNSLPNSSNTLRGSPNHMPQIKVEAEIHRSDIMFPDKNPSMPIPVPNMEKIPPWLRASHQNFWNKTVSHIGMPLNPPIPEHRRERVHGRQPAARNYKKPFKFHSMDFKPPHSCYPTRDMRKSIPPHAAPYRSPLYMSRVPPRSIGPTRASPSGQRNSPSMNMSMWPDPKDEKPILYSGNKFLLGQHGHGHNHYPCKMCNPGSPPVPHVTDPREMAPKIPYPPNNRNWPFNQRPDHSAKGKAPAPHLRIIFPKSTQKDVPFKSRSPFDRDPVLDQNMMNRCIIKAQQALKTKSNHEEAKRPRHSPDTPVFKSDGSRPFTQKMQGPHSLSLPTASGPVVSASAQVPRVSTDMQHNPPGTCLKKEYESPMKKLTKPDSSLHDVRGPTERGFALTDPKQRLKKVDGSQDYEKEGTNDREKLTMTPELECAQDDVMDSAKLCAEQPDSEDCVGANLDGDKQVGSKSRNNKEISALKKPNILPVKTGIFQTKDMEPARPKSCDNTFGNTGLLSMRSNRSPSPSSDVSCSKSASPGLVSKMSPSKIAQRRHTHTYARWKKQGSSAAKKKYLKRSSSSESPHGDTPSDESDGTPRKLIKKLKLRVIKSPGSEHKKYWTLVEQDTPRASGADCEEASKDESSEACPIPIKEPSEKQEKTIETEITVNNSADQHHENVSNVTESESCSKESEAKDEDITPMVTQNETPGDQEKEVDPATPDESVPECTKQVEEAEEERERAVQSNPCEHPTIKPFDSGNILTGNHVENALTAISLQPDYAAERPSDAESNETKNATPEESDAVDAEGCATPDTVAVTGIAPTVLSSGDAIPAEASSAVVPTQGNLIASSMPTDEVETEFDTTPVETGKVLPMQSSQTTKHISNDSNDVGNEEAEAKAATLTTSGDSCVLEDNESSAITSTEKPLKSRTTRSNAIVTTPKPSTEKKTTAFNAKKVDTLTMTGSASNRLRRSVRIRKTSADKDKDTTGKKKK